MLFFLFACLTFVHRLDCEGGSGGSTTRCQGCDLQIASERRRKPDHVGKLPSSSAKIRKVMELLELIDGRSDGKEKTIVFSQFTSMLEVLEPFLIAEGFKYVRCTYPHAIAISSEYVLTQRR